MCYLVGVCTGCTYFTHKHELNSPEEPEIDDEDEDLGTDYAEPVEANLLKDIFHKLQTNTWAALIAFGGGLVAS